MSYPKWVSRGYGLGEILCTNEEEESAVHADIAARAHPEDMAAADPQPQEAAGVVERKKPGPKPKAK